MQRRFSEDYLIAKLIKVSFKKWMLQTCFSLMARKGICSVVENLVMIACGASVDFQIISQVFF